MVSQDGNETGFSFDLCVQPIAAKLAQAMHRQ